MRFQGSVVLVAGGTGGLGRALVAGFLAEGATVAVTSRHRKDVEALAPSRGAGERIRPLVGDVADPVAVEALVGALVEAEGRIDAMVNAVGAWEGGSNLWEASPETYPRMLAANLHPGYALARAVLPHMVRRGQGACVEVSSRAALVPAPGAAAYAASKAAALALYASLAEEVKDRGVRVNVVLPSVIDTAANRKAMPDADHARWPSPEEIAKVVLFLCSSDARVVQGAAVPVYGRSHL